MFNPGQETPVTLPDGRSFLLGRLTVSAIRAFRDWCAESVGDPFAEAERFVGRVPEAESLRMIREAEDTRDALRYFSLASPLAMRMLQTEGGAAEMVRLLLLAHHPAEAESAALAVAMALGERLGSVLNRAQGDMGEGKAPAGASPASGPA